MLLTVDDCHLFRHLSRHRNANGAKDMQAALARELTDEEEAIAFRTFQNSKRLILAEPHVRRLAALTIGMQLFIEELKDSGDEVFMALADILDTAGEIAREAQAAMRG